LKIRLLTPAGGKEREREDNIRDSQRMEQQHTNWSSPLISSSPDSWLHLMCFFGTSRDFSYVPDRTKTVFNAACTCIYSISRAPSVLWMGTLAIFTITGFGCSFKHVKPQFRYEIAMAGNWPTNVRPASCAARPCNICKGGPVAPACTCHWSYCVFCTEILGGLRISRLISDYLEGMLWQVTVDACGFVTDLGVGKRKPCLCLFLRGLHHRGCFCGRKLSLFQVAV
jgi:hypothetical protein